jgi:hypothetical protein
MDECGQLLCIHAHCTCICNIQTLKGEDACPRRVGGGGSPLGPLKAHVALYRWLWIEVQVASQCKIASTFGLSSAFLIHTFGTHFIRNKKGFTYIVYKWIHQPWIPRAEGQKLLVLMWKTNSPNYNIQAQGCTIPILWRQYPSPRLCYPGKCQASLRLDTIPYYSLLGAFRL